jgi:hypothetical protein
MESISKDLKKANKLQGLGASRCAASALACLVQYLRYAARMDY